MPAQFTAEDVLKIAALANLKLEPDEIELFARQLGDILKYADQVQGVDTSGVPPTASVSRQLEPERADEARPSLEIEEALANAPDADHSQLLGGFFKVPRVIG